MESRKSDRFFEEDQPDAVDDGEVSHDSETPDQNSLGPYGALYVYYHGLGVQPWLEVNRHGNDQINSFG